MAIGALDDAVAGRILADFDLALAARQADARGRRGLAAVSRRRSAAVRFWPAVPVSSGSPASGPVPGRLVRLGQVIPVQAGPAGGEVYLLSYAQTEPGPQPSLVVRSARQAGPSGPARCLDKAEQESRPGSALPPPRIRTPLALSAKALESVLRIQVLQKGHWTESGTTVSTVTQTLS